jgi:hypothetical protein
MIALVALIPFVACKLFLKCIFEVPNLSEVKPYYFSLLIAGGEKVMSEGKLHHRGFQGHGSAHKETPIQESSDYLTIDSNMAIQVVHQCESIIEKVSNYPLTLSTVQLTDSNEGILFSGKVPELEIEHEHNVDPISIHDLRVQTIYDGREYFMESPDEIRAIEHFERKEKTRAEKEKKQNISEALEHGIFKKISTSLGLSKKKD